MVVAYLGGVTPLASHRSIDQPFLIQINLQRCHHIELFDVNWLALTINEVVSDLGKQLRSFGISIGLSVELRSLKSRVLR